MYRLLILILAIPLVFPCSGQQEGFGKGKVYEVNYRVEAPVTAGLFVTNYFGFKWLAGKPYISPEQLTFYDRSEINVFNRSALSQSAAHMNSAQLASDWGRNISLLMPALLFLDKDIRNDWMDVTMIYFETQAVNLGVYFVAGPGFTHKARPLVYHPDVPQEIKTGVGATDSWFSGHTSSTAAATFFMAKVYSDYHPELGNKKYWLYAAAVIPPAFVGLHRYRALKHFPRDVMVGAAVGAAVGILIPHLHKSKKRRGSSLTLVPFTGENTGVAMSLKF